MLSMARWPHPLNAGLAPCGTDWWLEGFRLGLRPFWNIGHTPRADGAPVTCPIPLLTARGWLALLALCLLGIPTSSRAEPVPTLGARIIAIGIPDANAVSAAGAFHPARDSHQASSHPLTR